MVFVMSSRRIDLSAAEESLLSRIDFSPSREGHDASSWESVGAASLALMESLVARKGIPDRRWRLFRDPACFVGGRGKSHYDVFVSNGKHGAEVFRDPNFVARYLKFLIHGPDLPEPLIASFIAVVDSCGDITGGDIETLCDAAKRLARQYGLDHLSVEEFFRLALDCDLDPGDARAVRDAIRTMR
jgi:hypothetical protein